MNNNREPLTYKDAGVDIAAGNTLVSRIKQYAKSTRRPEVLGGLGGFGSLCEIPKGYVNPVLVAGTDGVGTKLALAMQLGVHDTIGIDLVAMCVNDLIVGGAEPLFFLDYFATGNLNVDTAASVIQGIAEGCNQAGCALVGGETAEMPGMYEGEDYDLAGFCVGVVEKEKIIDGSRVAPGDQLIALASSGPHSNGYSLIRKVLDKSGSELSQPFGSKSLGETLLEPTRIYVRSVLKLLESIQPRSLCHITGGGFYENIPRVMPDQATARIFGDSWQQPAIFQWIQQQGNIETTEMHRVFNCGVGMVIAVAKNELDSAIHILSEAGEQAWHFGTIEKRHDPETAVVIDA